SQMRMKAALNRAVGDAIRTSEPSTRAKPPPAAGPFTAAMIGCGSDRMCGFRRAMCFCCASPACVGPKPFVSGRLPYAPGSSPPGPPPLDLAATVGVYGAGRGDPTTIVTASELWRAARTPDGPGTLHLRQQGDTVAVHTWGPGGPWLRQRVPALLGHHDRPHDLVAHHPVVADAHRRHPGLRIGRTEQVLHALVPAVLAQRVTGLEARRSWLGICRALGEP